MFGQTFYYSTTRKYIIAFGTLFNDIRINRTDASGTVTQIIKVPLTYAVKDKMMARINQDADLQKSAAIVLPAMSFELVSMTQDPSRKKNTLNQRVVKNPNDANTFKMQYQSTPWNLNFNLYIYVKNAEDGTKILEQIIPYFKPNWDMTLNILPEMGISIDTPVIIGEPSSQDNYDTNFTTRRAIVWTVPFTMKCEYFGPIKTKPVIKFVETNFYFGDQANSSEMIGYVHVKPGLDANGHSTSNSEITVDANTIFVDDDFGFVVDSAGILLVETDEEQ
jgi:hypothetical protein